MAISDQILKILAEDMGPSAKPFLERQCTHIKKDIGALSSADLAELAKWVETSAKLTLGADVANKLKTKILAVK